jgi:hypothetical protein
MPAAAQDFGIGLSFLGDEGGTGIIVDYAKAWKEQGSGKMLSIVGDLSYHHKGFDNIFGDFSVNTLLVQGGVRIGGAAGENLTWHGQGLIGIARGSTGGDAGDLCDLADVSCSDTDVIFTPGGALSYALNEKSAVRAQLDLPIGGDDSTTRFSLMYVMKLGN